MSQSGTDNPLPQRPEHHRLPTLDLLRGLAVLGIVAINVAGFTGPKLATLTPSLLTPAGPQPASPVDESAFALLFLLVEGKMRALFTMLFGASMLLFIERMEAAGRHGMLLQARRLLWLGLFGYLHYILLWWGDVLFVYALCGLIALAFAQWPPRMLLLIGGMGFVGWALLGGLGDLPLLLAEEQARLGAQASTDVLQGWRESSEAAMQDSAQAMLGFWPMAADKLRHAPFWPLVMAFASMGETLPLMLLGMALYRLGFWQGQWNRRSLAAPFPRFGHALHSGLLGGAGTSAAGAGLCRAFAAGRAAPDGPCLGAKADGGGAHGILQLYRHHDQPDRPVLWLGRGPVWPDRPCAAIVVGTRCVGCHAGMEQALAGPFPPRAAGMAVAQSGGISRPALPQKPVTRPNKLPSLLRYTGNILPPVLA